MVSTSRIKTFEVALGFNSSAFERGMARAQTGLQRFSRLATLGLGVAAVAATGFAVGFVRSMDNAIDAADEMFKASQSLGTSTESLSQLTHAAEMSGSSFETMQTALRRVSTALEDVANGSQGPAARAFEALGVAVQNADGSLRSVDEVIADVSEAFAGMEDGAQKTAAANAIFGRSGAELIPMLNQGRAGLQAMRDEADRLGITLTERAGRSAEAFNDNIERLKRAFTGIRNQVADALLPVFERFSDALVTIMGDQELVRGISQGLVEVFKRIAVAALEVSKALYGIGQMALAASGGLTGFQDRYLEGQQRVLEMNRTIDGLIDDITNDRLVTVRMTADGLGSIEAARTWAQNLRRGLLQTETEILPITQNLGQSMSDAIGDPLALTTDAMTSNLDRLGEESRRVADSMGSYFGDMLTGLIDGTQKWDDALKNLASNLASNFLNNSLSTLFRSLPGMGGGGGGFLSSIFGSFGLPSFDGGGFTGHGSRSGGIDGKGGFLAINHPNETIFDHTRGAANSNAQGGSTHISMSIDMNGSVSAQEMDQMAAAIVSTLRKEMAPTAIKAVSANRYAGAA